MRARLAALATLALAACNDSSSTTCPDAGTLCGKTCTLLAFDPANCGACGHACTADQLCINGACADCAPGLNLCGAGCTDLKTDSSNCGSCTHSCNPGEACRGGACVLGCPSGLQLCSGVCVDNGRDPNNCGACGHSCNAGELCLNGNCQLDCPSPFATCTNADGGSYCADPLHDPANCGGCGNVCGAGESCVMGSCARECPAPFKVCPTVTLLSDGGLVVDGSDAGLRCVDVDADPLNCGGCGSDDSSGLGTFPHLCVATSGLNTAAVCVTGSCASVCAPGFLDCDDFTTPAKGSPQQNLGGIPNEEQCTDPAVDPCNCGGCGNACNGWGTNGPNSCYTFATVPEQLCCNNSCKDQLSDTSCGIGCQTSACDGGTPSCCPNAAGTGGACTFLPSDLLNCGGCGNNCNNLALTGPECCSGLCTDSTTDVNNCGSCGNVCPTPDGGAAGCCPVATDAGTLGACVDTNADPANCGACGHDCFTVCGSTVCSGGACQCP